MSIPPKFIHSILPFERLREAANLTARALKDNPSYCDIYRFEDENVRINHFEYLFYLNFCMVQSRYPDSIHCGVLSETNKLCCVFLLVDNQQDFTLWNKITSGLLTIPFYSGFDTFSRLMKASDWSDLVTKELTNNEHYLYLQRMVVEPNLQGLGVGSSILSYGLEVADKLQLRVFLSTQKEINVKFYSKL